MGHLQAEAPVLQGPAETQVLLVCTGSKHILKNKYMAAVKCLVSGTSVEMETLLRFVISEHTQVQLIGSYKRWCR